MSLIEYFSSAFKSMAFDSRLKQIFIFITSLIAREQTKYENSSKMCTEAIFTLTAMFGSQRERDRGENGAVREGR